MATPYQAKYQQCVETIQGLPKSEMIWLRNSPDHKRNNITVVKTIVVC